MMLAAVVAMALPASAQGYWQEAAPSKGYKGFVEAGYAFGIQFHDDYYLDGVTAAIAIRAGIDF